MAVTRSTPTGWVQETTSTITRATPSGWLQETTGGTTTTVARLTEGLLNGGPIVGGRLVK